MRPYTRFGPKDGPGMSGYSGGVGMMIGMAHYIRNHRRRWSRIDLKVMERLARENTPLRVIGFRLGRTDEAVRAHAAVVGISLRKRNQRPYAKR